MYIWVALHCCNDVNGCSLLLHRRRCIGNVLFLRHPNLNRKPNPTLNLTLALTVTEIIIKGAGGPVNTDVSACLGVWTDHLNPSHHYDDFKHGKGIYTGCDTLSACVSVCLSMSFRLPLCLCVCYLCLSLHLYVSTSVSVCVSVSVSVGIAGFFSNAKNCSECFALHRFSAGDQACVHVTTTGCFTELARHLLHGDNAFCVSNRENSPSVIWYIIWNITFFGLILVLKFFQAGCLQLVAQHSGTLSQSAEI